MHTAALMLLGQMAYRQEQLIADAERYRLLAAARRRRSRERAEATTQQVVRGDPGTLAPCGPSVAAPAR